MMNKWQGQEQLGILNVPQQKGIEGIGLGKLADDQRAAYGSNEAIQRDTAMMNY